MVETSQILIEAAKGALVGGVIGWVTNKLAVWMLFHPHHAVRILGFPVPLTPGLVVKNQEKLADAIGHSVARDLLDSQTLLAHLQEIDLAAPIKSLLGEERRRLLDETQSLGELLGKERRSALELVRNSVRDDILRRIRETGERLEAGSMEGSAILRGLAGHLAAARLGDFLAEKDRTAFRNWLLGAARDALTGETGSAVLERLLGQGLARLPETPAREAIVRLADEALAPHLDSFSSAIQEGLAEFVGTEDFEQAALDPIATTLYQIIIERFSMAAMFITDRKIAEMLDQRWDDIVEILRDLLKRENLGKHLRERLTPHVDNAVETILAALQDEQVRSRTARRLADEVRNMALGALDGPEGASLLDGVVSALFDRPIEELLALGEGGAGERAAAAIGRHLGGWLRSEGGQQAAGRLLDEFFETLLFRKPVGELMRLLPDREWEAISMVLGRLFHQRAMRLLPAILSEHVDLAAVVSAKIREFDSDRIEETIVRVSGRELKGIVRLGGVIGLVVGAVMQVIYLFI